MKCPKCGSERTINIGRGANYKGFIYECEKNHRFNSLDVDYQQRLDNVLSKFGSDNIDLPNGITLEYLINNNSTKFYLCGSNMFNNDKKEISLKTVEHLLEDLEVKS